MDLHKKIVTKKIAIISIIFIILYLVYKNLSTSLVFQNNDRINLVFYGQNTTFYSLGKEGANYFIHFQPDFEILIPGGYNYYRIGALNKLVNLEKKPDIYKKAFSINTFSFVDYYFYPNKSEIFYNNNNPSQSFIFSLPDILLTNSNANLINRLYLFFMLVNKRINQFKEINVFTKKNGNSVVIDYDTFINQNQGYLYNKTYRNENLAVQIIYTKSYKTAYMISNIIEGEGIRVVDIGLSDNLINKCQIIGKKETILSKTAKRLSSFFNCQLITGQTETSDIILILGNLEKDWLIE